MMGEISIPETKGDLDTEYKEWLSADRKTNADLIHRTGTIKIN